MNLAELERLVAKGESDRLEFKASTGQRTEAAKTVSAMLNGMGGFVALGVSPKGELLGQEIGQRTVEELTNELARIEPPAFPDIETVTLRQGRSVIVLRIPGGGGIYGFDGRYYWRVGPTTRLMPRHEHERRLVERLHATRRWENEPVPREVTVADLDAEEIHSALENAVGLGRLESPQNRDTKSILRGFELMHEGRLLNAAVVLFGDTQRLHVLYPQLELRLARFGGADRLADFIDNRQYWGHAFDLLRRGETFLRDHVRIAGRVEEGKMRREDRPAYPPRATREAIANAICHRDYAIHGGAISIAMYDDRLEVASPGGFHFGMEPAKLAVPHESKPWNPIIANVFYRAGIIERWGIGTLNMVSWCREFACPAPEWKEQANSVYAVFKPAASFGGRKAGAKAQPESGTSAVPVQYESLSTRIRALLKKGPLSVSELSRRLGQKRVSGHLKNTLSRMVSASTVEFTIPDKPNSRLQRYRLTEKERTGRHHPNHPEK